MKAKDVMNTLSISRSTLYLYTRDKKLKVTKLHNGYYDYDNDSVFKLLNKDNRVKVIYARVSTYKQKMISKNKLIIFRNIVKIIILIFQLLFLKSLLVLI